ncbi:transformation/transcription domain-associated protein isoform X2 [Nematostella vectensis]|uniref:transformation/transcription domain-associated protein isoform X2 n=1 Tax=Nematostella vectensis TaxID=45351 RepID=UPI00207733A9|nr:transformation/transcription domain-associated protein isoform X2 [Nematostella vectensis]
MAAVATPSPPPTQENAASIIKKFTSYTNFLTDAAIPDESKLKAAQEISENFETIIQSSSYPSFLEHAIPKFLQYLRDGEPQFVAECTVQQLRKLLLEILHRVPTNEHLRAHYKSILSLMFHLLEIENEENVLVCLRIIIELHKQFRPPLQTEIQHFLQYVKNIYKELPVNVKQHFEVVSISTTGFLPTDSQGGSLPAAAAQGSTPVGTHSASPLNAGDGGSGKSAQQTNIPKAVNSLKVLAELPIIVVLMYQLYKQSVYSVVADFIPLVMNTIVLQPSLNARKSPTFNKEVYVDFVAAQIKTLSFLAYIIRIYQEMVNTYSQNMVGGMLGLLRYCPPEVAHLRKELLIAARHILATDLRNRFVPHIDQLFDEEVLIGTGWTTKESLRPLTYSTLADLVHHVRTHLPLPHLSLAVHMFSKNVHDDSLPVSIQTMSCKLLLNLVECIRQKSDEQGSGREILIRMLEVFVRKFQSIAKHHIPVIFSKCQQVGENTSVTTAATTTATQSNSMTTTSSTTTTSSLSSEGSSSATTPETTTPTEPETKKPLIPSTASVSNIFTVPDCRSMVKTLVCGVKTITWGAGPSKVPGGNKTFLPWETQLFTRLLKYALQALDIYQVSITPNQQYYLRPASSQQVRMKEEKEILEHFAGVFTMMNTSIFKEVFSASVEYLVERIHTNYALQIIPNSFLANPNTSATFATILVKFLLERLDQMGSNMERSNLYLKLFKLVFGSVSLFASENEQMLKPHLHEIVNRSIELACTSKEPYNYFLLLRALFRSIGGGSHDLLYQEFLPLLPNLLQGLNNLQSGVHRQYMKDLFVELCLTVPVRLSSLLPYLPMLMDPLVSALNGSQTLVSQGLRTLELCVDNLQPDFLYDHIQPVRAELFQALWKTLRNPNENIARIAFRVLGKFGGGNRRMLKEPQKLTFNDEDTLGPCLAIYYPESITPVTLSVSPVIERALTFLKTLPPNMSVMQQQSSVNLEHTMFYRRQAWLVVRSYLVAMMSLEDTGEILQKVLTHKSFKEGNVPFLGKTTVQHCNDVLSKKSLEQALTGALLSASIKELRSDAVPFMCNLIRHLTLIAVVQQTGPCPIKPQNRTQKGMDVHVLCDAIAAVMAMEDKEFCSVGELAVSVMIETATAVTSDSYKAVQLPIFEYLCEKLCACCYERAWFAKSGGCTSIRFLIRRMPLRWLVEHQLGFINALFFVMMDLTNEVSAGTVDNAKEILVDLLKLCNTPASNSNIPDLETVQQRVFPTLCQHLIREIVSPNETVRLQAQRSMAVLAQVCDKTVYDIMLPHKSILEDMIPPKKHLLRHQPVNTQIALMDGNTFCTTLTPRLFTMDVTIVEHKVFFTELLSLCEADDAQLLKLPCYKAVQSLTPLRKSALNALSVCHYIVQAREKIFSVLYKALNSSVQEIQETAKDCLKKFMTGPQLDMEHVHMSIRPLLLMLGDYRSLNLPLIQRLSHLMELFPGSFNEKLCEQLLAHLKKWVEVIIAATTQAQQTAGGKIPKRVEDDLEICTSIINMFHLIPAASSKLIDHLIQLVLKLEKVLLIEVGSPMRAPLLKFLTRYPSQTVDYFLLHIAEPQMNRLLMHYLSMEEDAKILRQTLEQNSLKLVNSTFTVQQPPEEQSAALQKKMELQYQGILIIRLLVKFNDNWLPEHPVVIGHLRRIWASKSFQDRLNKDGIPVHRWREPKLLVKCLLNYIKHRPDEVEPLFHLLRVFTLRHVPDFHFLRKFLDETVAKGYTVKQKRHVFFSFVDLFVEQSFPQELKAKALQYVIIPMFQVSFDLGEVDLLIGGPPNPDQDSSENVISVFVSKVIDPADPFGTSDAVRILLLQFSALLVEHASQHIHDAANKKQGTKLRRLMTFAWPCLLPKQCVDPSTKYHGHLLLAHIIAKFAIHKRIVLQVFHSLLKAHAVEARSVVRQALEILTPAMPARMEDGNTMLTHWTKKIIVEEGHTVAQLVHMLQLLVRHYRVYYPVRIHLIQHMVSAMQRLGFTASATIDHRKLAVDLAEVIIKWELQRIKSEQEKQQQQQKDAQPEADNKAAPGSLKRPAEDQSNADSKRPRSVSQTSAIRVASAVQESKLKSPLEKHHSDSLVNFLLRIACQVNEPSTTVGSPGEALSRRCVLLLKTTLRPDLWPGADLRVLWIDKLLVTVEQTPAANYANVCTAIEILTYLLSVLPQQTILTLFKPLQRGIATCMTCQNTKVIRAIHTLLGRLMTLFPLDTAAIKHEELEMLYNSIAKVITDGLTNYERVTNAATSILYGPLMMLKAACMHNPSYIDSLMNPFMRALQRMHKDHISAVLGESTGASEMLTLCLELIKNRLGIMSPEVRKLFFFIITTLIEKSPDSKLLRAITKIVEDWIKTKVTQLTIQHLPSLREKTLLLVRMMINYEKRFPEEFELQAQFLELVNYVYRDEGLMNTELAAKLEPAFLSGLRCIQPQIRSRFMEVFDKTMKKKLYDRLVYIFCSQNWEAMGAHFWIKQCIELLLAVSVCDRAITPSSTYSLLPSISAMARSGDTPLANELNRSPVAPAPAIPQAEIPAGKAPEATAEVQGEEPMDTSLEEKKNLKDVKKSTFLFEEQDVDKLFELVENQTEEDLASCTKSDDVLVSMVNKHGKFLEELREVKTASFLGATAQLCHSNSKLAHKIWVDLFPQLWVMLSDRQQQVLAGELSPFMCSGSHLVQMDIHPSAVHTILEGVSKCDPVVPVRPCILKYLGKTQNSWHRAALTLEEYSTLCEDYTTPRAAQQHQQVVDYAMFDEDATEINPNETLDSLAEMYSLLNEEDMWAALWQQHCKHPETATAIAYETQGFYEQAQSAYELAMNKARDDHNKGPANPSFVSEYKLWEEHWLSCAKELGQWDLLMEFGKFKSHPNPFLVLESAWRVPEWQSMKEALAQVELNFPENIAYKLNLYRGFIAICHPDEQHLNMVEKLVERSTDQAIRQWRRLPTVISQQHLPLLQAAQQIIELQEAAQIHMGLQPQSVGRSVSLHDMKAIVKTWRNRLPMASDSLSHWSDIFMWRHHHYQAIVAAYEGQTSLEQQQSNHAMLGVHASAWAIIHYGYIARKQNLTGVCLDSLSRIHTIPSVPIVDCFQKIRQQVKCYLQMAGCMDKTDLQEGLEVIESTNLKYFTKEMTAEFFALKGMFLAHIGRSEDANKAFSQAVQMHDSLVKAWALWGDYLDNLFMRERNIQLGVSAIVCYLHACRHQNESKCRKYLARVIWLMTYDDEKGSIADAVDKYCVGVPPLHWLPWIPQLLSCLVRREGQKILNLLCNIGRVYPQAMYFPIRTLYLTWKIEQRERHKVEAAATVASQRAQGQPATSTASTDAKTTTSASTVDSTGSSKAVTTTVAATTTRTIQAAPASSDNTAANKAQSTSSATSSEQTSSSGSNTAGASQSDPGAIRATAQMWRCSKIMHMLRDLHPTLLSALEGIVDQMVWFRECWHEEVLRQLRQGLTKCYQVAFETRGDVSSARITPHTLSFVKKLVSTFGIGFEPASSVSTTLSTAASESLARRAQATAQDPVFQKLKEQFASDFDFSVPGAMGLHSLISKLKKWIRILEEKAKLLPSSFLLEERCRFLSNFTISTAEVELPGEFLMPKANTHSPYYIRIARFMPKVELVQKHNFSARRLFIRGNNGKVYPYLVVNDACMTESRREERILQLLRLLNLYFEKRKEACKRHLLFSVPRVVAVSPQMRLIEDNPSFISLREILGKRCDRKHIEADSPIALYYERLAAVQSRGLQVTHQVLRDILREIQSTMVPEIMLKEWAQYTYADPTDYWTFRKQFCVQLTLLCFAEFTLHLTRLGSEMLQVAQDSGRLTVTYFRFEIDDSKGELDANRPVPFRLTPNMAEFVTPLGVSGVMSASMVAAARCLVEPQFSIQSILRAVLRDEMIAWHKKQDETFTLPLSSPPADMDSELLITLVTGAVNAITTRLQNLAQYEGGETKVSTLIAAATSGDNLCRMDPAWHPWL